MTNKEIHEMIKRYESKWGKLGHTNLIHSGINEEEETKMSNSIAVDRLKFRQKVLAGREANKLAHTATIDVDALNKRYLEEIMTNGTLIHAGTNQNQDYKYYNKIELPDGSIRYFYTKAEWDAYQEGKNRDAYNKANAAKKTSGGASAQADIEAQKRNEYEQNKNQTTKTAVNKNTGSADTFTNMKAEHITKLAEIAKSSPTSAAKEYLKDNDLVDSFKYYANKCFADGTLKINKDGKFEYGNDEVKNEIEDHLNRIEKACKQIGDASGTGRNVRDEVSKILSPEIEKMSNRADNAKNAQSGREAAIKKSQESNGESKVSKEYKEELENNTKNNNYGGAKPDVNKASDEYKEETGTKSTNKDKKSADVDMNNVSDEYKEAIGAKTPSKSEKNESWKETQDKILDDAMKSGANLKDLASKYGMSEEYIQELVYNVTGKTLKNEDKKVGENIGSGTSKPVKASKEYEEEKENNTKKNKYPSSVKHSSEEPEIMDEYSAFMERVKKGREKNKLAHSIMISPSDLNARYEQSIKDHCFLVHSGNFKYYNKIDLGNGQSRYFYTKAEWDAYQNGKKATPAKVEVNKTTYLKNPNGDPAGIKGTVDTIKKVTQDTKEAADAKKKEQDKKQGIKNVLNLSTGPLKSIEKTIKMEWEKFEDPTVTGYGEKYDDVKQHRDDSVSHDIRRMLKDEDDIIADVMSKYGYKDTRDYWNDVEKKFKDADENDPKVIEALKDEFTKIAKINNEIDDAFKTEYDKAVKATNSLEKMEKAGNAFNNLLKEDFKKLSKTDQYLILEELGMDEFSEEGFMKKYDIPEDYFDNEWITKETDDYGAEKFDEITKQLTQFLKDYKKAKKVVDNVSDNDDED